MGKSIECAEGECRIGGTQLVQFFFGASSRKTRAAMLRPYVEKKSVPPILWVHNDGLFHSAPERESGECQIFIHAPLYLSRRIAVLSKELCHHTFQFCNNLPIVLQIFFLSLALVSKRFGMLRANLFYELQKYIHICLHYGRPESRLAFLRMAPLFYLEV